MGKLHVTPKVFSAVKIMLNGGATNRECADYMSISPQTVGFIKKAEDYNEYQNIMTANSGYHRKKKAAEEKAKGQSSEPQVVEHRQSITVVANHYMMEELKQQTEYLKLISNKLAFLIDELTK